MGKWVGGRVGSYEGGRKKRVAHIRDVRGRSHSFSESLETFFELARACGQPLVAYYE